MTFKELRETVGPETRELLTSVWTSYLPHGTWPLTRAIHSNFTKPRVLSALKEVNGSIIFESRDGGDSRYQLLANGVLLTENGANYEKLLIRYLEYLRHLYHTCPEKQSVSSQETAAYLSLSNQDTALLGALILLARLFSHSASWQHDHWQVGIFTESDDFQEGELEKTLEDFLLRNYNPQSPIFYDDQVLLWSQSKGIAGAVLNKSTQDSTIKQNDTRYQVFIGSTFDDLREERQKAIQALLEFNCFPCGMELFPAASTNQWELIKKIIGECDYYVLIVAARYGSLIPGEEISYTEREFDYARSIDKPILAFCHEDIDNVVAKKTEQSDIGKERLHLFRSKVMESLLVKYWTTPDRLGSVIKSAIYNQIRSNPQRGWIRTP